MRAFGYIRVSESREGMISPDIQRTEIERYCQQKNWTLLECFEDLDISGRTDRRPALQSMLQQAQDGNCDVIVFYRIDRLSREPIHHYAILHALKEAGVLVDSVGLPMDGTPEGVFMWDLSAALAKLESLRHGKRIRDAHKNLRRKGRYHGGMVPYGMRRKNGGGLEPEPQEARWVTQIHEWYQRGWALHRIARELNQQRISTKQGRQWSSRLIDKLLTSPYYAGGRQHEGELITGGNIEGFLSPEIWRRTQELKKLRTGTFRGGRLPKLALTGRIVKCGTCGSALQIHYAKKDVAAYRCQEPANGRCQGGAFIRAHILEPVVLGRLLIHLKGVKAPPLPENHALDISPLTEEMGGINEALIRLATAYAEEDMTAAEYQGARTLLIAKRDRLGKHIEKATQVIEHEAMLEAANGVWEDLGRLTSTMLMAMSPEARREIYELCIERVTVNPRGGGPRITVKFRW